MPSSARLLALAGLAALAAAPASAASPRPVAWLEVCGSADRLPLDLPRNDDRDRLPACHAPAAAAASRKGDAPRRR